MLPIVSTTANVFSLLFILWCTHVDVVPTLTVVLLELIVNVLMVSRSIPGGLIPLLEILLKLLQGTFIFSIVIRGTVILPGHILGTQRNRSQDLDAILQIDGLYLMSSLIWSFA